MEAGSSAWPAFLEEYSPFILSCVRRFAMDEDERMEIYVHVCCRLVADNCRRVRNYRGQGDIGSCKFSTWLAAVVFNLAREWIRSSRGRRRLFQAVKELGRTDRLVFKYYFWEGYSTAQIAMLLRSREQAPFAVGDVVERLKSIERRLSRDHRWRLVTSLLRSAGPLSIDQPRPTVGDALPMELPSPAVGSNHGLEREQAQGLLRELIDELPDEERIAIRMRFDQGLTAREVARALGFRNYKRVYEVQGRALAKLATGLRSRGVELEDFILSEASSLDILT